MNRERAKELLPIIQAFAEGKDIQHRWPPSDLFVSIDSDANFELSELEWRIKSEPREFWIDFNNHDEPVYAFHTEKEALMMNRKVVHVREVLDD